MDETFITRLSLWVLLLKEHWFFSKRPLVYLVKLIYLLSVFIPVRLVHGTRNGRYLGLKQTSRNLGHVSHVLEEKCKSLKVSDIEGHFVLKNGTPFAVRTSGRSCKLELCTISNKGDWNPYFFSRRFLCFESKSARHDLLVFYPEYRGCGDARKILDLAVQFYLLFGIDKIFLTAGLSGGGAYWIKAGFVPLDKEYPSLCKRLKKNIRRLPRDLVTGYETVYGKTLETAIEEIARDRDPEDLYQLRMLKVSNADLGKMLFTNTRWDGVLDLRDSSQRKRLDTHLGKGFNDV